MNIPNETHERSEWCDCNECIQWRASAPPCPEVDPFTKQTCGLPSGHQGFHKQGREAVARLAPKR